jgi:hypothetical protein
LEGSFWKSFHKNKFINKKAGETYLKAISTEIPFLIDRKEDYFTNKVFRRSAATIGANSGLTFNQLKAGGNWSSDRIVQLYINSSNFLKKQISGKNILIFRCSFKNKKKKRRSNRGSSI